jgi:hypothetical protein
MPLSTPGADPRRPAAPVEGTPPHLTFEMLLADTLYEMAAHDEALPQAPDAVAELRDHAVQTLRRTAGPESMVRPFHHAYLTPTGTPSQPSRPSRLDVRS